MLKHTLLTIIVGILVGLVIHLIDRPYNVPWYINAIIQVLGAFYGLMVAYFL